MTITCTGGSPSYGSGCGLLKHYARPDGIIADNEANLAISDGIAGNITDDEVNYIIYECWTQGGNINTTCPGCYTPQPPVITTITVSPNPASIASGVSQTFTATPKDQYGDQISATITWSNSNSAAGSINSSTGVFTASSVSSDTTTTITATSGSIIGIATATILRPSPILTTIIVSPNPVSIASGISQLFTASPKDQYGNPISTTITWSNSNQLAGSISSLSSLTGLFSASSVSTNTATTITATSGSINGSSSVTVTRPLPILTTITVSPNPVNIASGGSQLFTASPKDQYNNPISATVTWSNRISAAGSINSLNGLFTASSVISDTTTTVTATSGSIHGTSTVTVTMASPILTTITVSPNPVSIASGVSQLFTATPKDQYSNPISTTITWSNSNQLAGSISSLSSLTGLFSASSLSSDTTTTITATSGSIIGTSTVTVTAIVCTVDLFVNKLSTFVGDKIILTVTTTPLTSSFSVDIYANNGTAETLINTIVCNGVCSAIWDTTGLTAETYDIHARIGVQCSSSIKTIILTAIQEAGIGGIGAIVIAGIGVAALISMKKPSTK